MYWEQRNRTTLGSVGLLVVSSHTPEHQYRMASAVVSTDLPGLLLPSLHQQKTPKLLPSELSVQKNDLFCDI